MYTLGQNRTRASYDGKRNVLNDKTGQSIGNTIGNDSGAPSSKDRVTKANQGAMAPGKKVQTGTANTSVKKEASTAENVSTGMSAGATTAAVVNTVAGAVGATTGAATGAEAGTLISPGWGTVIGGVIGLAASLL